MWDILFQGGIERREIKEMDECENWKLTDLGNEIATVIVKLKNLLQWPLFFMCLWEKKTFTHILCMGQVTSQKGKKKIKEEENDLMWVFYFKEGLRGIERREIKEMDECENWKLIDLGNEIETVIVKLKNLLKWPLFFMCLWEKKAFTQILCMGQVTSQEIIFSSFF